MLVKHTLQENNEAFTAIRGARAGTCSPACLRKPAQVHFTFGLAETRTSTKATLASVRGSGGSGFVT